MDKASRNAAPSDGEVAQALKQARSGLGAIATQKRGRTPEEKAALEAERQVEKERKAKERAARKASKPTKPAAHMRKVERAAAKLPRMPAELKELAEELGAFDSAAIEAFIANVQHSLRAKATLASTSIALENGQLVRIVSGSSQHIGKLARVTEARRIRCHVEPLGTGRKVYLLNSDVVAVDEAELTRTNADEGADNDDLPEVRSA